MDRKEHRPEHAFGVNLEGPSVQHVLVHHAHENGKDNQEEEELQERQKRQERQEKQGVCAGLAPTNTRKAVLGKQSQ